MPLRKMLENMVAGVSGCTGAVIMGMDGIAIDEYIADPACDLHLLAIEYAVVMKEIRNNISVLEMGQVEEMTVATSGGVFIARPLDENLFVILAVRPDGIPGKARYLLRRDAGKLAETLM